MGAWAIALQSFKGDPLPVWHSEDTFIQRGPNNFLFPIQSYYFARDDRVYKNFVDRMDRYSAEIKHSCGRQLKRQFQVLKNGLGGRSLTFRVSSLSVTLL